MTNKEIIEGPAIRIVEKIGRFEIVKQVVSAFIDFEKDKKGRNIEFKYPVEDLSIGEKLYIHRPGVKWNFDFKVEIPKNCGLEEGRHDQIALILRNARKENEQEFNKLWGMISELYHCSNNDVDCLLFKNPILLNNPRPDVLLKVIKWLFIMEDIIYWHYEGRAFLYNFFFYVVNEINDNRLENTLLGIRKHNIGPDRIKNLLEELNKKWELP
ncbi:MAG: hypothetical protein NC917_03245 [Candidatus Omnitrophica bacterium]|nr:hypothetical protein [Candidatus Omnitrophota bacterium]